MSGLFIALDKQPRVRAVGVGVTWLGLMAKYVLRVTGKEANAAFGTKQLTGGVKVSIVERIHAMRLLWEPHPQEEDWGFLLIDARNAFNEDNRTEMLWIFWNEWPSGAQFTFNCYRHWSTL